MNLLLIGCVLASAYSANVKSLGSEQYFERTPNNNLVQIKHIGVQGGGLYDNRQFANRKIYGYDKHYNNQFRNHVSQVSYNNRNQLFNNAIFNRQNQRYGSSNQKFNNQRFQNQFNNQNQRLNHFNQQNPWFSQYSQAFNQEKQNFNQQNQLSQFSQHNRGFSQQTKPFSFNNQQFGNRNPGEISFNENHHQQFNQDQERQGHHQQFLQDQERQGHYQQFLRDQERLARHQLYLRDQEIHGQEFQNQQIQRAGGRLLILTCHPSLDADYQLCLRKCATLVFSLETQCRLKAMVKRKDACWNYRPTMTCPA